jgi:hypothetical protein
MRSVNCGAKPADENLLKERPGFGKKLTGPIFAISPRRRRPVQIATVPAASR